MLGWHDERPLSSLLPATEARALKTKFGYTTAGQLLQHYPRKYAVQGGKLGFEDAEADEIVTIIGTVVHTTQRRARNGKVIYTVLIDDHTQRIEASFFGQQWLSRVLSESTLAMFTGKVKYFRGVPSLQHPDFMVLPTPTQRKVQGSLSALANYGDAEEISALLASLKWIPIYPAKAGFPTWRMLGAIATVLAKTPTIPDPLGSFAPKEFLSFDQALRSVLLPMEHDPEEGLDRLKLNEALEIALVMALRRHHTEKKTASALPVTPGHYRDQLLENLPFALTKGQHSVIQEISADLASTHPMSRLLQGEVGSGKTIVSLINMLQAIDAGKQCALLAPTEVLANQHLASIQQILHAAGIELTLTLLTSAMPTKEKQVALLDIMTGQSNIVVGTHAIIQEGVEFFDLGFYIVDEQHRFGVEQRDYLRGQGNNGLTPHLLVMTATPIPRTIAMTAYSDLSVSTLKELPGGRKPIASFVVPEDNPRWLLRAFERIREEVRAGRQAYMVCPRIQGEGGVEEVYALATNTLFTDCRVGCVHGRLPSAEKDATMTAFAAGEIDILVATTVIEVGIDVPNATIMFIREAERFGVSQLHQLRGRVGRGGNASLCFFHLSPQAGPEAQARIESVAVTHDGFELAEIDLLHRQEGDVLGARQSGASQQRLLSLSNDYALIVEANALAKEVVQASPATAMELTRDVDVESQAFIDKS